MQRGEAGGNWVPRAIDTYTAQLRRNETAGNGAQRATTGSNGRQREAEAGSWRQRSTIKNMQKEDEATREAIGHKGGQRGTSGSNGAHL